MRIPNNLPRCPHRTPKFENQGSGFKLGVSICFPPHTWFRLRKLKMPLASLKLGALSNPWSQTHHPIAHQEAKEELPTLPGNLTPPSA